MINVCPHDDYHVIRFSVTMIKEIFIIVMAKKDLKIKHNIMVMTSLGKRVIKHFIMIIYFIDPFLAEDLDSTLDKLMAVNVRYPVVVLLQWILRYIPLKMMLDIIVMLGDIRRSLYWSYN